MNEITSKQKLLNKNGTLANPGYAKHMLYAYDRSKVKCAPLRLKEWDFYQIHFGHIVLQITMGHISYASSVSATLIDLDTGKRKTVAGRLCLTTFSPTRCRKSRSSQQITVFFR